MATLRSALKLDAAARPSMDELRSALVAEAGRPVEGAAQVAGCWVALRRGFGDGQLYRAPAAAEAPIEGLHGAVDFFWRVNERSSCY